MPDIRAFKKCPCCDSTKICVITYYRCESFYKNGTRVKFQAFKVKDYGKTYCLDCNYSQPNRGCKIKLEVK